MLKELPQKFSIDPIIDQVSKLEFTKRLTLNQPTGSFFNDPWETLSKFKGTPLGNVLDSLSPIGQARLLTLESAESYTAHTDPDDRLHLAIITNEYSFLVDMLFGNLYHVPADGTVHLMDTSRAHVAANWGGRPRIHLNIRVLLPHYTPSKPGLKFKVNSGDFDWKQISYIEIMGKINYYIKTGIVTGFKAVSEKELIINCDSPDLFQDMVDKILKQGVDIEFTPI